MLVTWQTVITAGAVLAAILAMFKQYNRGYEFVRRQQEQDKLIQNILEEQTLLTYGVLACLKGLREQGADGPVEEAINKIEKHINEKAHGGLK